LKLGNHAKLSPGYYGPFEILEWMGPVAYKLTLTTKIKENDVSHVSFLKKYAYDPNHLTY